jgi:heme-degrading monooxygenase HmoA
MVVVVFRSRLKPDAAEEYGQWAARIGELARTMPGYVSHKGFTAPDGERVTIVEFQSEEHLRAWAANPDHVQAKRRGREAFYSEYRVQICAVSKQSSFQAS